MPGKVRSQLSYANVMATIAVLVALGGTATAAALITGRNVKNNSLTGADIKNRSLGGVDIRDSSLLARDIKFGQVALPSSVYDKTTSDGRYLSKTGKATDSSHLNGIDSTGFVNGDGTVLTGARLVGSGKETLVTVTGNLMVEGSTADAGKNATLTFTNLSNVTLNFASSGGANPSSGTIAPGGSLAILIGLLQPATFQILGNLADAETVHTVDFTAFGAPNGEVEVVGQALSGR
jgi:hypothetical protein